MSPSQIASYVAQVLSAGVTGLAIWFAYRWLFRRNRLAAIAFAIGLLVRIAAGLALAGSAYLMAPPERRLLADPRWFPDAILYYTTASNAAADGLQGIEDRDASPAFTRMLAVWMRTVGAVPAAGLLLNVASFAAMAVLLMWPFVLAGRAGSGSAASAVAAFALSPNLMLLATQPLKDTFFATAFALTGVGLWGLLGRRARPAHGRDGPRAGQMSFAIGLVATALGVFVLSGIRTYFGLMVLGAVIVALVVKAARAPRGARLSHAATAAATVAVVWLACMLGGGPYYDDLAQPVTGPLKNAVSRFIPALRGGGEEGLGSSTRAAARLVDSTRAGFEIAGGATNLVLPGHGAAGAGVMARLEGLATGLAATFVPITLLQMVGMVSFQGGGRMLIATDIDTLVMDASIVWCLMILWLRWRELGQGRTFAIFAVTLGVVSALLLGYVVTNFGTLFRLRLLAAMPFWLAPLALAQGRPDATDS